ncbi:MAG TPA: aspartate/glutamate racemase family protein, partial [Steroidobacteraceae bacterium]|nr:aspartate/glutamate racemase family protein [Steroidobacteraceae bacterium]
IPYYRIVNQCIAERLGGLHSARVLLYSVDFHDIERLQHSGNWTDAGRLLAEAARRLETAGADFIILCTNTMHKVAPEIEAAVAIPLLHIADPTALAIKAAGCRRVGLLGTRFTMAEPFYRERLQNLHGLEVLVPEEGEQAEVHRIIYQELCRGQVRQQSAGRFRQIIARLVERGAQAIILGCTEISMLVSPGDAAVPLFDTTELHARSAAERALG